MPLFTPLVNSSSNSEAAAAAPQQHIETNSSRLEYSASLTVWEVSFACTEHVEAVVEDLPLVDCTTMLLQTGVAVVISVLPCVALYLAKAPNHFNFKFATSVALLFAASLTVCRTFLLERKHQVSAGCAFLSLPIFCHFKPACFRESNLPRHSLCFLQASSGQRCHGVGPFDGRAGAERQ